ncbi:hypothetical protein RHGRI_034602 [Rhododendron griersonianum]|uniref:Uncharacterized protein n=1 Tax=Rhododendron griersonianum TaxID=479676 RepID=A0AAV6I5U8_9ERIC|nr:hypothetical protein RHGRI_034602 [Rhododendron griersonianum]
MNGIVCVVNISQVLPSPFADPFSTRGDKKFTTKSTILFTPSSSSPSSKLKRRRSPTIPSLNQQATNSSITSTNEIRVCVNRTCRRQGSMETLKTLSGIAPPHVSVNSCGCLGRCGAGPNLVVLPQSTFFAHCGTPARAARVMLDSCGGDYDDWTNSLAALALRNRAEDLLANVIAINLKPFGGIHVLYKARSSARLVTGNLAEALEDAKEALTIAPKYPEAYICQGDALMAMEQFDAAERSYAMALELDPSIRRSKSFKYSYTGHEKQAASTVEGEVNQVRLTVFKVASMMARGVKFSLAVPLLASIYHGLKQISSYPTPSQCKAILLKHCVYDLATISTPYLPSPHSHPGVRMVRLAGEKMAKHFIAVAARNLLRNVDPSQILSLSLACLKGMSYSWWTT